MTLFFFLFVMKAALGLPVFENLGETVYINMENNIRISMHGCEASDISVKVGSGSLYKRNDSTYVLVPQQEGEEIKVKLYYKKVICDIKTVKVIRLPDLIPYFESENLGKIPKTALSNPGRLRFIYPADYPSDMASTVISYSLLLYNAAGQIVWQGNVRGESPDASAITECRKLSKGSRLYITNILTQNSRQGTQRVNVNKDVLVTD